MIKEVVENYEKKIITAEQVLDIANTMGIEERNLLMKECLTIKDSFYNELREQCLGKFNNFVAKNLKYVIPM